MFEFSAPLPGREGGGLTRRTGNRSALVSPTLPGIPRIGQLPCLRTKRLLLRSFTLADFPAVLAIMSAEVSFTYSGRGPLTPAETWARLARNERHWRRFGFGLFAVEEVASGTIIGEVGHANFVRGFGPPFDQTPEASWTLAKASWGQGFGVEAAEAAHRWLNERMALERTVCLIMNDNRQSIRLAQRLGYEPLSKLTFRKRPATTYYRLAQLG